MKTYCALAPAAALALLIVEIPPGKGPPMEDLLPEAAGTAIAPPRDILDAFTGPSDLPNEGARLCREFNEAIDNGPKVVLRLFDILTLLASEEEMNDTA